MAFKKLPVLGETRVVHSQVREKLKKKNPKKPKKKKSRILCHSLILSTVRTGLQRS